MDVASRLILDAVDCILDLDDSAVQTYAGMQPMPGVELFLEKWGLRTALLSIGIEAEQLAKLARANLQLFKAKLFVGDADEKAKVICRIASNQNGRSKPIIMIGNHLEHDIEPARRAGLIAVRIRHESGKYSKEEPKNEYQNPTHTVRDFHELLKLPEFS